LDEQREGEDSDCLQSIRHDSTPASHAFFRNPHTTIVDIQFEVR
jgi:hypothetical protein